MEFLPEYKGKDPFCIDSILLRDANGIEAVLTMFPPRHMQKEVTPASNRQQTGYWSRNISQLQFKSYWDAAQIAADSADFEASDTTEEDPRHAKHVTISKVLRHKGFFFGEQHYADLKNNSVASMQKPSRFNQVPNSSVGSMFLPYFS
jgi:hypothetical protein